MGTFFLYNASISFSFYSFNTHNTNINSVFNKINFGINNNKQVHFYSSSQSQTLISCCLTKNKKTTTTHTMSSQTNPVVPKQKIVIPNSYGEKLVGTLHETGSENIVVLCHGFQSTKDHSTVSNLATALEKDGITVFRFDFAGNGESEGTFQYANYWREAEDLRAVIEHFSKENRIPSTIIGHSKGGNVVLLYASKYHDIPTVVNISGRYDLKGGIEERMGKEFFEQIKKDGFFDYKNRNGEVCYRVTEESLNDRLNTNMHEACLQIDKDCRVLTVHGSKDTIIPVGDAADFSKIIPNHKLHVIKGANHGYTSHQHVLASVVLPFIKQGH